MNELEYRTADKSQWFRGEWDNEPDKMQFTDEETSLPCLIVRNDGGALCGYVGVSDGHPFFAKHYNDCTLVEAKPRGEKEGDDILEIEDGKIKKSKWMVEMNRNQLLCPKSNESYCEHTPDSLLNVHGGITFTGFCQENAEEKGICHKPSEGEPNHIWWLGFDCSHSGDLSPAYTSFPELYRGNYKNIFYVKQKIKSFNSSSLPHKKLPW